MHSSNMGLRVAWVYGAGSWVRDGGLGVGGWRQGSRGICTLQLRLGVGSQPHQQKIPGPTGTGKGWGKRPKLDCNWGWMGGGVGVRQQFWSMAVIGDKECV